MDSTRDFLQHLVNAHRLTPAQAQAALEHGQRRGVSPFEVLVEQRLLQAHEIPVASIDRSAPEPSRRPSAPNSLEATLPAPTPGLGLRSEAEVSVRSETRGDSQLSQSRTPRSLPDDVQAALAQGRTLGRYAILGELGRGGMGVVLRAYDPELRRAVAIKQLLPRAEETPEVLARRLRRFQLEGQAAAKLHHPGIVGVLEVGESEGRPFLVMDYVKGQPFDEVLDERRLSPREICELIREAADALGHAHGQGIVHRDVKPANILVDAAGRARLTDFGLARDMDLAGGSSLSQAGQILGTPQYLSPEQAAGKPEQTSPASDVFALGGVLYLALTGVPPFDGESLIELIRQVVDADPVRPREINPQINRDLETVILKCLAQEPARRYPDGAAVARELERFLAGEAIEARPLGGRERLFRLARRNKALTLVLGASLLTFVAGGLYSVLRIRSERDAAEAGRAHAEAASAEAVAASAEAVAAREQALAEGERARAAEAAAQANALRVEREVLVSRLQIARALREKGQRLAERGFHNEAAALFAESLRRVEDPYTRGQLARALVGLHPAAYDPPTTRTALLPFGEVGGYLVGSTTGSVTGLEGAPTLPDCPSSVRSLVRFRDQVVAGLLNGGVYTHGLKAAGEWRRAAHGSSPVIALALNAAGDRVAALWEDGSLRVSSDLVAWTEVLAPASPPATALAWGPAGLVIGDLGGRIRLLRGSPLVEGPARADVHAGGVAALSWVGPRLASLGYEGTLVRSVPGDSAPLAPSARVSIREASLALAAVNADEVAIGLLDGGIEHRRLSDFHPVREFILGDVPVRCLAVAERYSYAGGQGISSSFDLVKNVAKGGETREAIYRIPGPGERDSLDLTTGGSVIWRKAGAESEWSMPAFPSALARDAAGELAASGDGAGNVTLRSSDGSLARTFPAHPGAPILSLAFAARGRYLLTACADALTIWSTRSGKHLLRRRFGGLLEASLSDDGRYAARFVDGTLIVGGPQQEDYRVNKVLAGPCFAPSDPRDPASPDTIWVATTQGITQVIGKKLLRPVMLSERSAPIRSLRVSRDGRYLLYARRDGVASLYRTFGTELLGRFPIARASAWPPELDSKSMLLSATSTNGAAGLWTIQANSTGQAFYVRRKFVRLCKVGPKRFAAATPGRKLFTFALGTEGPEREMTAPGRPVLLAHDSARGVLGVCGNGFLAEYSLRETKAHAQAYQLPDLKSVVTLAYWPPLEAWLIGSSTDPELFVLNRHGKWRKQPANEAGTAPVFLGASAHGLATGAAGRLDLMRPPKRAPGLPAQQSWSFGSRRLVTGAAFGAGREGFCITSLAQGHRSGPSTLTSLRGELWLLGADATQRRVSHAGPAFALANHGRLLAWIGGRELYLYDSEAGRLIAVIPQLLPEHAGTVGLEFLDEGQHLLSVHRTRSYLRAWKLAALGLFDTPEQAVERVARLTRLRVAGLEAVNQPDPGELVLARRLAAR